MTNFSGVAAQRLRLTPAQVLVGLPIVAGGLLAMALVVLWVWPQWQQLQVSRLRMAEMITRRQQLPALRQQLAAAQDVLQDAANQRGQVLGLIAGVEPAETFLTALADVAAQHDVTISRYEPRGVISGGEATASTSSAEEEGGETAGNADSLDPLSVPAAPLDPLLSDDLRRQQILVTLQGRYGNNVAVLRALEAFRPLVIVRDFKVEGKEPEPPPPAENATGSASPAHGHRMPVITLMNLTLSVYTRKP